MEEVVRLGGFSSNAWKVIVRKGNEAIPSKQEIRKSCRLLPWLVPVEIAGLWAGIFLDAAEKAGREKTGSELSGEQWML